MFWENLLHGNEWYWRLLRTIIQGALGVIVAELDTIVGSFSIDPVLKPMIVAIIMAVLSPIMAALGTKTYEARMAKMANSENKEMIDNKIIYG